MIGWLFKIVVWVFLGPWMKLVDIFYIRRIRSDEETKKKKLDLAKRFQQRYSMLLGQSLQRKVRKESALKMKEMKKYMFGKYLMHVPVYKEERFYDDPIPESYAESFDSSTFGDIKMTDRKYGQILKGDMIPERELRLVEPPRPLDVAPKKRKKSTELDQLSSPIETTLEEAHPLLQTYSEEIYGSLDGNNKLRKLSVAADAMCVEVIDQNFST